jgi:hypothetical protein
MQSIPQKYVGETVTVLATGPSLNEEQVSIVKEKWSEGKTRVLTLNNSYLLAPWSDIHIACNDNWWDYYHSDPTLVGMSADKWTRYEHQEKYGLNFIESHDREGLSKDPSYIHINKGSGPMAINFATLYGFTKIILLGHDMKFAKDYAGKTRTVGSTPRHFFGEYPSEMQHFPMSAQSVADDGTLRGLVEVYSKMLPDLEGIDVVNCTPGTSLYTFRLGELEDELN